MCWDFGDITGALEVISTGAEIVGTGLKAFGSAKASAAEEDALLYNAAVYEQNQKFAELEAQDAIARGKVSEQRQRIITRQLIGTQRTRIAANNIRVDTGNAKQIQADTARLGELDALTIRENAAREARGIKQQAKNFGNQAALARSGADSISPFLSAAPDILTGSASVADKWLRFRGP